MKKRRAPFLVLSSLLCTAAVAMLLLLYGASADAPITTRYVAPGGACGGASPCYAGIQDAVDAASPGDTIKVAQGVYTAPGFQVVYIDKAITLTGGYTTTDWVTSYPGTYSSVLDAENVFRRRGVYIDGTAGSTITLRGLVIQGGNAQEIGGGGIYIVTGTVKLENLQVRANSAQEDSPRGGGIYVGTGTVTVSNCLVEDNISGGGLFLENGTLTLIDNAFKGNKGSGVAMMGGTTIMKGNLFEGNTGGGGVYMEGVNATLLGNTFEDNWSWRTGGGIHVSSSTATLSSNTFVQNSSEDGGGGVNVSHSTITLSSNIFDGNSSDDSKGGGLAGEGTKISSDGDMFLRNSAYRGGGAYFSDSSVSLSGDVFENNSAQDRGGGLSVWNTDAVLTGNAFLGNSAAKYAGGIILQYSSSVNAQNDIIANGTGALEAVYLSDSTLVARHWTLANNGSYALTTDTDSMAVLTNTIVASHTAAGLWGPGISADHTLFFANGAPCGSGASCTNDLAGNPSFANPVDGDYHIQPQSAAADTGIDAGVTTDIDGEPRPMGTGFDIGADEVRMGPFLAVAKSVTPDPGRPGNPLTYTLYVTNTGTVSLTVTVTEVLPSHVTPSGIVTLQPPQLLPAQVWSETILVTVDTGYLGPLTNTVEVSSEEGATGSYTHTVLSMKGIYLPVVFRSGS